MKKILVRKPPENTTLDVPGLHPLLRRIYLARGITSQEELNLSLDNLLPYKEMLGLEGAVECLWEALQQQKKIIIVGDFDADGATSTALLLRALRMFGYQNVSYLVPSRFEYGYGLTAEIVEIIAEQNPELIITVDNGISSITGVDKANELGIEVLVTDHHLPGSTLPKARAIVDPNQPGDSFPSKNLAGVGVIFYVMLALRGHLRDQKWFEQQEALKEPNMASLLDIVALGTVADVVPLDKNNRILVAQGLRRIREGKCCCGITALIQVAKCNNQSIAADDLGYRVGPRLNAAGRLIDMKLGIECLTTDDIDIAKNAAEQLNELNIERRIIENDMKQQIASEIIDITEKENLPKGLCLFDETWHQGVVGLLASRVKEKLHRPVIAFAKVSDNEIKGSARSIHGVHIKNTLESIATKNPLLITKFGGHAMAAGLSLVKAKYSAFCDAFINELEEQVTEELLEEKIHVDGELQNREFSIEIASLLKEAGPWGQGFPAPLFYGCFDIVQQRLVAEKHLKLTLAIPGGRQIIDAIAFNVDLEKWPNYRCDTVTAIYRLEINEYNGNKRIQLIIEGLE